MVSPAAILLAITLYVGFLFLIGLLVERKGGQWRAWSNNPVVYSLSLAVYCTSWTYYGSVGKAATTGMLFMTIYLGPTLTVFLWWTVLRKLVRIKNTHRITSIADFISARYDKSQALGAIATLLAVLGIMPYIALQFKAVFSSFALLATPGSLEGGWIGPNFNHLTVVLLIVFTVLFGVRRLSPGERHEGIVLAIAVESVVKLVAFLAAGAFVTYHLFDGFGDIFHRLQASPFMDLMSTSGKTLANPFLTWTSYMILSMSAIIFLPRQFHVAVVENSDEDHIRVALWLFPLYLLLITIFAAPVAMGGLLLGLPAQEADNFVLLIPLTHGVPALAMLTFIGGFAAATGMVIICSMTLAVMLTNHILLPVVGRIERLSFLKIRILECRWVAVALVIGLGYWFERQAGNSYTLVNIGIISFAAVLQFAPAILGGIFWRRGNKIGALLGLSAGSLIWLYTSLLPSLVRSGWLAPELLTAGPWGVALLKPEHLLGLRGFDPTSHTVFWSLLLNVGLYVLGSLVFTQSKEERALAEEFVGILEGGAVYGRTSRGEASIDLRQKRVKIRELLEQYFPPAKAREHLEECLRQVGIATRDWVELGAMIELHEATERCLAGAIGAASAREAVKRAKLLTADEAKGLSEAYAEILADLYVTPDELRKKIDFYQEKEIILTRHARELEGRVRERDEQIAERQLAEAALRRIQEDLVRKEKLAVLGQLAGSVGHELRNPLGVMNNAVYFLKAVLSDAGETVREYLDIIKQEIDRSQRIITDLLDFARTKPPTAQLVQIRELVSGVLVRCAVPETITVRTEFPEDLPGLAVDPLQIGQVLQNLVTNAAQAMTEGVLTIRGEPGAGRTLKVSVSDTGGGISPEGMSRLFQPLFTTKARGIGLGLTVCKNLAEANGGRIEVETRLGEGTTFTVVLPIAEGTD